jgi:hypothetical protein
MELEFSEQIGCTSPAGRCGGYNRASRATSSRSAGIGQPTPARSARQRQICTLERAHPTLRAICRSLKPSACSRKISRIRRTDNLSWATFDLLPGGKETTVAVVALHHTLDRHVMKRWTDMP